MKFYIFNFLFFYNFLWAQQIGTGFEGTSFQGMASNIDESFVEKEGVLKKSAVAWKDILNKCEGNIGLVTLPHPLLKSRCCYLDAKDLGIQETPLFTVAGMHGFSSLTEIRRIGAQNNNSMFSFAVSRFQKIKNIEGSKLVTCFPIAYENLNSIGMNDYYTLFALMKQYANAHPEWKLEYFYLQSKDTPPAQTPCELIAANGDVNKDGKISSLDLIRLTSAYIKKNIYEQKLDFNNDGKLDTIDADLLRDYILKKLNC
jgi:hypothetical protein